MILWLDDIRDPNAGCPDTLMMYTWREYKLKRFSDEKLVWVKTYKEFVDAIKTEFPKAISFDNDLGQKLEGVDCAKWLFQYCIDNNLEMPYIAVHSANPICAREIYAILEDDWAKYKKL